MKIIDGEIRLNVFDDILDGMTKEQRLDLAKLICFDDDILNDFIDRLMTDYAGPNTDCHIHNARLRMVDLMPQAASDVIKALVREVEAAKFGQQRIHDWAWKLWHLWDTTHSEDWSKRPNPPSYESVPTPSADEVMERCGYVPVPSAPLEPEL